MGVRRVCPSPRHRGAERAHPPRAVWVLGVRRATWAASKPTARTPSEPVTLASGHHCTRLLGTQRAHRPGVWHRACPSPRCLAGERANRAGAWAPRVPISLASGQQAYYRLGTWALSAPVTWASKHKLCPSPWHLGTERAHHLGFWVASVSTTPASGHRAYPSLCHVGTDRAHRSSILAASVPIAPASGQQAYYCLGIWALSMPVTWASKHQACPSPWHLGTERAHHLGI